MGFSESHCCAFHPNLELETQMRKRACDADVVCSSERDSESAASGRSNCELVLAKDLVEYCICRTNG